MHLRYIVPRDWSVGQLNVRDVCDCETVAFSNTGGTPMKVVQGLSVSLTAGVVRKFLQKEKHFNKYRINTKNKKFSKRSYL